MEPAFRWCSLGRTRGSGEHLPGIEVFLLHQMICFMFCQLHVNTSLISSYLLTRFSSLVLTFEMFSFCPSVFSQFINQISLLRRTLYQEVRPSNNFSFPLSLPLMSSFRHNFQPKRTASGVFTLDSSCLLLNLDSCIRKFCVSWSTSSVEYVI